jgi:hypothetical protein
VAVVSVATSAPAATTTAVTATTMTAIATIAAVAAITAATSSISRLQASESGHGQGACQQTEDAAARGGVVGIGQLLRELVHVHSEKNSLIDWEAIRLQVRRHSCYWRFHVPGRGAILGYPVGFWPAPP